MAISSSMDAPLFGADRYKVVIAGAGMVGSTLARMFESVSHAVQLTVIDQREYFENPTGVLRAVVDSSFQAQTSVPHHVWMKDPHKTLIMGAVVEVRERTVIVETNGVLKEIPFNAFVMCTGTNYPHFKEDGHPTMEGRNLFFFDCAEKIRKAERIVIAGGGTSGCELCGEIMHAFPDKKITLVHTKDRVITESPIGVSELMMQKLIDSGVEVILEDHVDVEFDYQLHDHEAELADGEKAIPCALFFKSRTICTRKGRKICADLVIPCLNGRPNTDALRAHFGDFVQESGHVDVRDTFQLPNTDTVFVAGDIVNREYFNLWINLKDHAEIVFRNVCDVVRGKHAYATLSTRGINEYPEITCFGPEYAINTSKGCCGFFKGLATGTKAWALQKHSELTMKPAPADLSAKK